MMYGFGDVEQPLPETVALVEARARGSSARARVRLIDSARPCALPAPDATHAACARLRLQEMVCDYLSGLVGAASERAALRYAKPGTEDVEAVVRHDAARAARAKELLTANEELRRARKMMETDEKKLEAM